MTDRVGAKNLSKPVVAEAIAKAEEKRSERVQVDQDWGLRQWKQIAEAAPPRTHPVRAHGLQGMLVPTSRETAERLC